MTLRKERTRLDVLIFERGLAASREKAQAMILAGEVLVNGVAAAKAGQPIARDAAIEIRSRIQKYVSRGGFKLEGALRENCAGSRFVQRWIQRLPAATRRGACLCC